MVLSTLYPPTLPTYARISVRVHATSMAYVLIGQGVTLGHACQSSPAQAHTRDRPDPLTGGLVIL